MKTLKKKVAAFFKKIKKIFHHKRQLNWDFFHRRKHSLWGQRMFFAKLIILVIILYLGSIAWIARDFLRTGIFTGRTLVLFTNEAEARPCGGFVSAYGLVRLFPPSVAFRNSYDLAGHDFGPAEPPLDQITETKNFWDLGTSPDLELCAEEFHVRYEEATEDSIDQVLLVDTQTIEEIFSLFGTMKWGGKTLNAKNLFAEVSRTVANVDRHNEEALSTRKAPITRLAKQMIWRMIWNPTIVPQAAKILSRNIKGGGLFSPRVSPPIRPEQNDFSLIEWNLGGAKSSRFLKKNIRITVRETAPGRWGFFVELFLQHLGGTDEPISQNWKGMIELKVPHFLEKENILLSAEVEPGRAFYKAIPFEYSGELPGFSIFRPRGQSLYADVSISLFPQKSFDQATFSTHENVGTFVGEIKNTRHLFHWTETPDTSAPFVTLHEIISQDNLSQSEEGKEIISEITHEKLFIEVHFNEPVILEHDFSATLKDLDVNNKALSEDPGLGFAKLMSDDRTLILGFLLINPQPEERYSLEVSGLRDFYRNRIQPVGRTVIDRVSQTPSETRGRKREEE
ncbi:DUF4012 domain-containing protein [Candidatus Gracilibacteria bacterium]|nr:DUF4012 domain-containing protein [Candidatus Gracilibacteria bacterium]